MLLQGKNVVIYGGGGSLGGAVAKAMATAGARIFLTGHRIASLEKVAAEILQNDGKVEVAIVDAFDEVQINTHLEKLRREVGTIDISFNAVDIKLIQGVPLIDLSLEEFVLPITKTVQTRFLTAKAAGRVMKEQQSGVILSLTATPGGIGYPYTAAFAPACSAVECFSKNLAAELGIYGVRVVNIRSGGSPDSRVFSEAVNRNPTVMTDVLHQMKEDTMLKKLPLMEDIANAAVFLASSMADKITGVTLDVTAGTTAGLNYRARGHETGPK